jgi:hypothetical protein
MKRIIEIEDNLEETINDAKEELLDDFKAYFNDNQDIDDFDTYYQAQGCDMAHEIADSNTPIYYSEIDSLYYLYGNEFDEAYSNAGIGDGTEDNHRQVTIYCYISEKLFDYMRELEEAFNEWLDDAESEDADGKMPWDYL